MLTEWSCVLNAFSAVCGISEARLIELVGHDGSAWLDEAETIRRGFLVDELAFAVLSSGWTTTHVPPNLMVYNHKTPEPIFTGRNLLKEYLDLNPYSCTVIATATHAFGYKNGQVLDKSGRIKVLPNWGDIYEAWVLRKVG